MRNTLGNPRMVAGIYGPGRIVANELGFQVEYFLNPESVSALFTAIFEKAAQRTTLTNNDQLFVQLLMQAVLNILPARISGPIALREAPGREARSDGDLITSVHSRSKTEDCQWFFTCYPQPLDQILGALPSL
ncbi:MAG: hypothetical protein ABIE84_05205 [bacterium]